MVEVRIKKKPERPRGDDHLRRKVEPKSWRDKVQRGANWMRDVFSTTGDKGLAYLKASNPNNRGVFRGINQYDKDAARYISNQIVHAGEFMGDILQLPFESLGQLGGYDVGSGQGIGDIDYYFGQYVSPYKEENKLRQENALSDIMATWPSIDDPELMMQDEGFQDHLRSQGFKISDDLDRESFFEEIISPNIQTFDEFEETFIPDNDYVVKDDDYWNMVYDNYTQAMEPQINKIYDDTLNPYRELIWNESIENLSNKLNISPKLSTSLLMGEQPSLFGNIDLGLLNDALSGMDPYAEKLIQDYKTEEGKEFFEDPVMELGGGLASFYKLGKVQDKLLKSSPYIRKTIGQAYPISANLRTSFPLKPRVGEFSRNFDIPFLSNKFVRSGAQLYGGLMGAETFGGE